MRTLVMAATGVRLALAFYGIGAALRRRGIGRDADGARLFMWIWLAVVAVDFWVGVGAGNAVALEIGVHLIIFAVPGALAWYLSRRLHAARAAPE
jgi:hypothetical protein